MPNLRALPLLLLGSLLPAAIPMEGIVIPCRKVELSAPVSSFIVEIKVQEGESVKAGQPLALLYGRLEELEMQRAKAVLTRREYEVRGANRLFEDKVIPEAKAKDSRFELEMARINYETSSEQVRLRTICSPMDGILVQRCREVGEAVSASQPVFRILDLGKVFVVGSVKAEKLAHVALGQKVAVRFPQLEGAVVLQGEVVLLDPRADADGHFPVKVAVNNPELRLKAGLKAVVDLPDGH